MSSFLAVVALIISLDSWAWKKMTRRDVDGKLLKMKHSLRSHSCHRGEKSTGNTASRELFFVFLPPSYIIETLARMGEAFYPVLGSLSVCFSLAACWISGALIFLHWDFTAGLNYALKWQRWLFPVVAAGSGVLIAQPLLQLALMGSLDCRTNKGWAYCRCWIGDSFLHGKFEVGWGQQAVLLSVPCVLGKKELCHVQDCDLCHLLKPKLPSARCSALFSQTAACPFCLPGYCGSVCKLGTCVYKCTQ